MKPLMYRMHLYEKGNDYINVNLLTGIVKPNNNELWFSLGEHFIHPFPFKTKEDALQTFDEIMSMCVICDKGGNNEST